MAISDSGIQLLILIEIGPGSRTLRLIALWLLFARILLTRYTKREFFLLVPLSVLALYNYTLSGNIYCIYTILVLACMKDADYALLFKTLFYSTLTAVLLVGILSFWEIGSSTKLTQDFGRGLVETRYCFGFHHPNIWHQTVARCIIFACLGYYRKLTLVPILILFLFNLFIFTMSVSRTGLLAVSVFLILLICYKYLSKFMHSLFVNLSALICMTGVYGIYLYYTWRLYSDEYDYYGMMFNWKIANGRIRQALDYLMLNPMKPFSSRFPDDGTVFDLGAYRLFYECGYLWTGLLFLALLALVILAMKHHWDIVIPVAVYFIFYSLYEFSPVTRPTYNIVAFFLPMLIFPSLGKQWETPTMTSRRKENPAL